MGGNMEEFETNVIESGDDNLIYNKKEIAQDLRIQNLTTLPCRV